MLIQSKNLKKGYLHFIKASQVCEETRRQTCQFVFRQYPFDTKKNINVSQVNHSIQSNNSKTMIQEASGPGSR